MYIGPGWHGSNWMGRKKLEGAALDRSVVVVVRCGCGELLAGGGEKGEREMALLPPLFVL